VLASGAAALAAGPDGDASAAVPAPRPESAGEGSDFVHALAAIASASMRSGAHQVAGRARRISANLAAGGAP
jgi:hypothetical protein